MNTYAYARVSARDQNLQRQITAFIEYGIDKSRIFSDRKSGKDFERKEYKKLIGKLKSGDLLVIKSIDRLGRNYDQIIAEWAFITNTIGADILVLDMPLLDTRRGKDLMGTFLSDIVLQVLSFVAENERENIRQRQREGIEAAKQRGVRFGRPQRPVPENFAQICRRWNRKEITGKEAAQLCNMSVASFYRKVRRWIEGEMQREGGN